MSGILTLYVLVWPVVIAFSLGNMTYSVYKDLQKAKTNGESLV